MCAVLHLALTKIVQTALPVAVLLQILRHVFGDEDVAGITTIHDPLCNVDSCSGYVCAATYVDYAADRSAMDSHA